MAESRTFNSSNTREALDYLLIYLLISLSGNQAFQIPALLATFALSLVLFLYRRKSADIIFMSLISFVVLILILQAMKFNYFPWMTIAGGIIKILVAFFIIKSVGSTFIEKYINIMVLLSLISIVFYLMISFVPGLHEQLIPYAIYTSGGEANGGGTERYFLGIGTIIGEEWSDREYFRNHGPFWEAGAFAGYLMIAMIFNVMKTGRVFNIAGIILAITVVTTVSTTAVLALFLLIAFQLLASKKNQLLKWMAVPLVIAIAITSFSNFEFLGEKIDEQLEQSQESSNVGSDKSTRFLDVIRDWEDLEGHELIGRGLHSETRFGKESKESRLILRTNGITDHLVRFGAIFLIITFALLYRSQLALLKHYKQVNKIFALFSTMIIIMLLQSEVYFNYPFFWGLMILYVAYMGHKREKRPRSSKQRSSRSFKSTSLQSKASRSKRSKPQGSTPEEPKPKETPPKNPKSKPSVPLWSGKKKSKKMFK